MNTVAIQIIAIILIFIGADLGFGHSVRQQASVYSDNQGLSRERYKADMNVSLDHRSLITGSSYNLVASRENYRNPKIAEDEFSQEYYGGGDRHTDSLSLALSQTWNRITDTRVLGAYTRDEAMNSRTVGIGISHWFSHETLQASVDVSRTKTDQPVFEYLDRDSDIVSPPPKVTSTGTTLSLKNLATPTTVMNYSLAHVESNDRPPANTYIIGVRQFIPKTESAIHLDIARAVNRGRVTTKTTYGQVDAWIVDSGFLQELWRGARARLGYRYYKEDEVTRAQQNEYVRGSDTISFNVAQELDKKIVDSLTFPLVVEAAMAQYRTNELEDGGKVVAMIYEVGVLAKF